MWASRRALSPPLPSPCECCVRRDCRSHEIMLKSLVAAVAAVAFATGAAVPLRPIVVDDHFVANVRATNITQCLAAHCQAQVAACTKDTQCNGGIQVRAARSSSDPRGLRSLTPGPGRRTIHTCRRIPSLCRSLSLSLSCSRPPCRHCVGSALLHAPRQSPRSASMPASTSTWMKR